MCVRLCLLAFHHSPRTRSSSSSGVSMFAREQKEAINTNKRSNSSSSAAETEFH
jgi:hypothetical protein